MSNIKWTVDPTHTTIGFKVKHMMFTNVKGQFEDYTASAETANEENLVGAKLHFEAKATSINTDNADRDNHLRSADFFDVEKYPTLKFESTAITQKSGNDYVIEGNLTIKDVTKLVQLNGEYSGKLTDPWGNTKSGLNIQGAINRKDFGLSWNSALETGGVLVSEEVKFDIELQFIKQ
ncbi:YceI family protein [Flavobacterium agricola]|uniref:YceI family protein n=1 Tax=Flavobacterium agricola TaxID=2870839 RepID=A0ABY6M0R5_9FLAO|nr:YceI family protein [Flavobacterium agricola]UYW00711.1 YceI family protein [Flavobacterium agricola]